MDVNYVEIILLGLPLTLGKSVVHNGVKVDKKAPTGEWPWDVMQRPTEDKASVIYDRNGSVYMKDNRGVEKKGSCHGAKLGGVCIGVYNSAKDTKDAIKDKPKPVSYEKFSSNVDTSSVKQVILHSDGTTDIQFINLGNADATYIGYRAGKWVTGSSCGYVESVDSATEAASSSLLVF